MSRVELPDWIGDDEVIRRFSDDGKVCKLPPWTGDDRAMLRWLAERLFAMSVAEHNEEIKRNDPDSYAVKLAEYGIIEPLRELYPKHAEFINLPKRDKGQRFPDPLAEENPILLAALDARRIRALWKKFYPGRRRNKDESAEVFAAELWKNAEPPWPNIKCLWTVERIRDVGITPGKIRNRLKKKLRPSK